MLDPNSTSRQPQRTGGGDLSVVAVTGALGHVASRLIPRLQASGTRVIGIVRPGREAGKLLRAGVEVRHADLTEPPRLAGVFEGISTLIHLSGLAQVAKLLPTLETAGVRRGVFVSSTGIYTRLPSAGAEAKRVGEAALRQSRIDYTILRPSMIYGTPDDRNLARLLRWLMRFPVVIVPGGGETLQQPVHVDDLVDAILSALDRPETVGREYDVGGPEALSLREVIRLCAEVLGRQVWIVPFPITAAHRAVLLLSRLGMPSPVRGEQVLRLMEAKSVDIHAAQRDLGFSPRTFREGIRAEVEALRNRARGVPDGRDPPPHLMANP